MSPEGDIHSISRAPARKRSNGGDGNSFDTRLRDIEITVAQMDEKLKHTALREDVLNLKIWILVSLIGGMVAAAGLAIAILRLVQPSGLAG